MIVKIISEILEKPDEIDSLEIIHNNNHHLIPCGSHLYFSEELGIYGSLNINGNLLTTSEKNSTTESDYNKPMSIAIKGENKGVFSYIDGAYAWNEKLQGYKGKESRDGYVLVVTNDGGKNVSIKCYNRIYYNGFHAADIIFHKHHYVYENLIKQ